MRIRARVTGSVTCATAEEYTGAGLPVAAVHSRVTVCVLMTILSFLTLVVFLVATLDVARGMRRLRRLDADPIPATPLPPPTVTIVIPARNEARHIAEALQSVLRLDYPSYDVVLVDDRSTDATADIARGLARTAPCLQVLEVTDLPEGWVGKSHALAMGARLSRADLLLFTDADVVMAPHALRRAVAILEADGLDHLAVAPRIIAPGFLLAAAIATFGLFFTLFTRPWRVPLPGTREHIGIGAFNLVRRRTYEAIGTHARIASAPDDDLQLGKAIKHDGHRQALALSGGLIEVEWYASIRELVDGLMKNAFAAVGYRVSATVSAVVALLVINVWPFVALLVTTGTAWWLNLAVVCCATGLFVLHTRMFGSRGAEVLAYPIATVLFCWILARAAFLAIATGGVEWRGRRYPLHVLRASRLR
jgi:hypothetical protein